MRTLPGANVRAARGSLFSMFFFSRCTCSRCSATRVKGRRLLRWRRRSSSRRRGSQLVTRVGFKPEAAWRWRATAAFALACGRDARRSLRGVGCRAPASAVARRAGACARAGAAGGGRRRLEAEAGAEVARAHHHAELGARAQVRARARGDTQGRARARVRQRPLHRLQVARPEGDRHEDRPLQAARHEDAQAEAHLGGAQADGRLPWAAALRTQLPRPQARQLEPAPEDRPPRLRGAGARRRSARHARRVRESRRGGPEQRGQV